MEELEAAKELSDDSLAIKLLIILGLIVISFFIVKIIEKALIKSLSIRLPEKVQKSKVKTISKALFSLVRFIIYFVVIMIILDMFGVNTSSILATAGIGGVAIAFGAQSLVSDFIRGAFILIDDQLNVGDFVTCGSVTGTVEEVGLRITKIRDYDGSLYTIPNSEIETVKNATRGPQKADITFRVSYEVSLEDIKEIIIKVSKEASEKMEFIDKPHFLGVEDLGEFSYMIKVSSEVKAMNQWQAMRMLREMFKKEFEENNIKTAKLETKDEKI